MRPVGIEVTESDDLPITEVGAWSYPGKPVWFAVVGNIHSSTLKFLHPIRAAPETIGELTQIVKREKKDYPGSHCARRHV